MPSHSCNTHIGAFIFKINVAFASRSDTSLMGFGILVWDFSGQVIAAMATQIMARLDRFCTVIDGCTRAIVFGLELNLRDIVLESSKQSGIWILSISRLGFILGK